MKIEQRPFTARVDRSALRMAITYKQLTYRELAMRAKVSKSTIGNLVSGQAKTCNPETASKIARALRVDTDDVFVLEPLRDTATRSAA